MSINSIWQEIHSLSHRSKEKEFMDDPNFQGEDLIESFKFIKIINTLGGGRLAAFNCIKKALIKFPDKKTLTVLDVGCGIGDMGDPIIQWGKARGIDIKYYGLERSEHIITEAKKHRHDDNVMFIQGNLFDKDIPEVDLTIISMVLHHLDDEEVVSAIKHLASKSRIALLINELDRSIFSYIFCQITSVLMKNKNASFDALLSVRKGFKTSELRGFTNKAGLTGSFRRGLGWRILGVIPGNCTKKAY